MLSRLGPADSVVAGQRMARVAERQRRRPLLPPSVPGAPGGHADTSHTGQGYCGSQRVAAAESDSGEATWSAHAHAPASAQPTFPFRVEHIAEAYRATDPVQPRPGLYLHVRA